MHNACIMLYNACMPTLQMRDVPDELYQELIGYITHLQGRHACIIQNDACIVHYPLTSV